MFPSKEAAKDYIRRLMERYTEDSPLGLRDFEFVYDLLQRHPLAEDKIKYVSRT